MIRPSFTVRLYSVDQKCISSIDTLRNIAICSEEIYVGRGDYIAKYIFDTETELFQLSEGRGEFSYNTAHFFEAFVNPLYEIYIKTREKLPFELLKKTHITKWGKIITDLEVLGYVKTFPTKSVLANDMRKFCIVNDFLGGRTGETEIETEIDADTINAVDVDFLGTIFAGEISDKILNLWQRVKRFKVLSKSL